MKKNKDEKSTKFQEEIHKETSIRDQYVKLGVKTYYEEHGNEYQNPHEERVQNVIKSVINLWNLDVSNILDLACGSGEVTLALLSHGIKNIEGIDPYTYQSFEKRTKMLCKPLSFEDIVNGKLEGMRYSLIICSYALHLASEEILPVLSIQLSLIAKQLVVITPHKKPNLLHDWGWDFKDEMILDRTRAKLYYSNLYT